MQAQDFLVVPTRLTMYFLRYLVALSRNHYFLFIAVGNDVPDNNKILFSFATEIQQFYRATEYFVLLLIIKVLCIITLCLYFYLSYPACKPKIFNAVLYCLLWPDSLHHIFSHLLIAEQSFLKKKLHFKGVF
jgi:hypothetical protein